MPPTVDNLPPPVSEIPARQAKAAEDLADAAKRQATAMERAAGTTGDIKRDEHREVLLACIRTYGATMPINDVIARAQEFVDHLDVKYPPAAA